MLKFVYRKYSVLFALGLAGVSQHAASGPVYAVRPDGTMLYYNFAGESDGSADWNIQQKVIGNGWQGLRHLIAGNDGSIYAIRSNGEMAFYRYAGMADGSFDWAIQNKAIGSGWDSFTSVFGGDNGAIYAIRPNGQLLFYRYTGMSDGSPKWAVQAQVIGGGWQNFTSVFGGENGAIYAIKPDGQMLFYRYAGMSDGSPKWAVEGKVIGTGWNNLASVFGGYGGAVYAIRPDGQMLFFRFAGTADGSFRWPVQHQVIGAGWNFQKVVAGALGSGAAGTSVVVGASIGGIGASGSPAVKSPDATRRTSSWSQWLRSDGVEYRYRWSWIPASSTYLDAIFQVRNPGNQTWEGSARSIDCQTNGLSSYERVTVRAGETRDVAFKTRNCGTSNNASFRAGVSRSYSL